MHELIEKALRMGAGYCDLRTEKKCGTSLEVKDGELKKAISGEELGASIRVLYDGSFGFYSTNDIDKLEGGVAKAVKLAKASRKREKSQLADVKPAKDNVLWKVKRPPGDVSIEDKYQLIKDMDSAIHQVDGILTVTTGYSDGVVALDFLSSENAEIHTEVTRTVAQVNLVAKKDGNLMGYRMRIGGTCGFEIFELHDPIARGVGIAKSAVRLLSAKRSPSGRLPVVVDPDLGGVFAHEALGHAVEGDLVVASESILENKLGQQIASEHINICDDPTLSMGFGSFPYDDEGVKGERKLLIENGILKGYILNRETAHKLGLEPNGGARAESFAVRPLVRMSNTMIENGDHSFEELIEGVKYGVYAKGTRGGQVDVAKGSFQFSAQEAFLIENGELTQPLRDVALSGSTLDILRNIDAVGKDYRLGDPGFCGKGQLVPVGDGGPHIRIKEAVVGGG